MSSGTPSAIHNNSTSKIFIGSSVLGTQLPIEANQVILHPGHNDEYAVARWLAPSAGQYSVAALFSGQDFYGTTTDVHLLHNGVSFYDGSINGFLVKSSFSGNISVAKGNTIDFAVGYGSNFNHYNDSTGLFATISPVPEPEEWAMMMLGLGLVGLVANCKKSNSVLSA